jgi:hypothetical protein
MFQGLGSAEKRLLEILRPGVPLTVTGARRAYPDVGHKTHRQAMQSLVRKGFVQRLPGEVFAIGVGMAALIRQSPPRQATVTAPISRPEAPRSKPVEASPQPPAAIVAPAPRPIPLQHPRTRQPPPSRPVQVQLQQQSPAIGAGLGIGALPSADEVAAARAKEIERQKRAQMQTVRRTTV